MAGIKFATCVFDELWKQCYSTTVTVANTNVDRPFSWPAPQSRGTQPERTDPHPRMNGAQIVNRPATRGKYSLWATCRIAEDPDIHWDMACSGESPPHGCPHTGFVSGLSRCGKGRDPLPSAAELFCLGNYWSSSAMVPASGCEGVWSLGVVCTLYSVERHRRAPQSNIPPNPRPCNDVAVLFWEGRASGDRDLRN